MAHEHDFSWRVELVAFKKEGLAHMGKFMGNLLSRGKELPGNAYFVTPLDIRINPRTGKREIFWKGYDRSISESMRRNAALLRLSGVPKERINQAKTEWQMWNQLQDMVLNLEPEQAVQFLALRGLNPEDGMALQQISWQDDQLVLESQLLPSGELGQMENLVALVGKDREMIEMNMERAEGLSPLLAWAVKGKAIDFKQGLLGMIQESFLVNQQEVGVPIHVIESMNGGAGIGMSYVHLGSGHEEVSVTKVSVYTLPVVVAPVASDFRIEERITEKREIVEPRILAPQRDEPVVVFSEPHPRGGVETVVLSTIDDRVELPRPPKSIATLQVAEHKERESIKAEKVVMPMVTGMIPVSREIDEQAAVFSEPHPRGGVVAPVTKELQMRSVSDYRIEEVITEGTELTESTEKISVPSDDSVVSVIEEAFGVETDDRIQEVIAEKHVMPMVTGMIPVSSEDNRIEEVITERTELTESTEIAENVRVFSAFTEVISVPSVIKEIFNKQVKKLKSILRSNARISRQLEIKPKLIWLTQQMSNVVADGLMGRMFKPRSINVGLGWLVHGLAVMQFDGIEEKQKMKRFSLSPVRIWADRVTRAARRVKDKFVRIGFGAYKHLFATI